MTDEGKICVRLVFSCGNSVSIQNKVHEFWKFLDADGRLNPAEGQIVIKAQKKRSTVSNLTLKSEISEEKSTEGRSNWYEEFKTFQHLGLDKVALATKSSCNLSHMDSKYRCSDYADTVDPSYEELSEEMRAFDERISTKKSEN